MKASAPRPAVKWKDLVSLSFAERVTEFLRPFALLLLEILAWRSDMILLGSATAFFFFLAGLRLAHDTFHGNLGVGRDVDRLCLSTLSFVMLGSMHAVRRTHLQHHRFCLASNDIEAAHARKSFLVAIAYGPFFPIWLHCAAWRLSNGRDRRHIALELMANAAVLAFALTDFEDSALRVHVAAMIIANWLTAFFAVWTVHHDCEAPHVARTLRNRLKSKLAMDMFYHEEHHLFPRVPTSRLAILARRLDEANPTAGLQIVY